MMLRYGLPVVGLLLSGCATITKGTTQSVSVDTPGVPGATCILSSAGIGSRTLVTPGVLVLDKSQHAVNVRCSKACYNDGVGIISSNTEGMTAGNILVGGVVGLGVDAASGAMNKYNEQNQIVMTPIPGCAQPALAPPGGAGRAPRTLQ
jgi:hypothetical protein